MHYIVNKNAQMKTGEHKIHTSDCLKRPKPENTKELGEFYNSRAARSEAAKYYLYVDGCKYCCKEIYLKTNRV